MISSLRINGQVRGCVCCANLCMIKKKIPCLLVTSEAVHVNNTLYISPNQRSFILILSICLSLDYFLTEKNGCPLKDTIRLFYDIPSFLATTNVFLKLRSNCSHMDMMSKSFKKVQETIYTRLHSATSFVTLSSLWSIHCCLYKHGCPQQFVPTIPSF